MKTQKHNNGASRATILREIRTPLAFFALVVLVTEGILGFLATKAAGTDFTILVAGMVVTLLALVVVVGFLAKKSPAGLSQGSTDIEGSSIKYDLFISSPMAAHGDDKKYQQNRADALKLVDAFRKECNFKSILYAGREIESIKDFEAPDISAADDIQALRESRFFVLYYPEKIVSSALFEAGAALVLRKPSLYFVKNRDHLPFLMRQAELAFRNVKTYECSSADEIARLIARHREKLFSPGKSPAS